MHLRYFAHPGFFVILILMYAFIVLVLSCSCWLSSGFWYWKCTVPQACKFVRGIVTSCAKELLLYSELLLLLRSYALKTSPPGLSWHGNGPSVSSPIDVTSLLPPLRYPHPHLEQQHNTCVRLGEATLNKAGEEADGICRQNLKEKKKELMFGHPEYHRYSACFLSVSKAF